MNQRGIPTKYSEQQFRSRLEARWAAFFDLIGWRWTYEPFDADGYIPDFLIHSDERSVKRKPQYQKPSPLLVEVKPYFSIGELADEWQRIEPKLFNVWQHDVLVLGVTPHIGCDEFGDIEGGLLVEHGDEATGHHYVADGLAIWNRCVLCDAFAVRHQEMSFLSRPCGHYDGDSLDPISGDQLDRWWRAAGNDVQWRKPQEQ